MKTNQLVVLAIIGVVAFVLLKKQAGNESGSHESSSRGGAPPSAQKEDVFGSVLAGVSSIFQGVVKIAQSGPRTT